MTQGGWSGQGRERLHEVLTGHIAAGDAPGLVTLIARGDEVLVETLGTLEPGGAAPVRRDTIFRISSMTKPVTAVATLLLVEEGRVALDEPVDEVLPELAERRVLRDPAGPLEDTVPAARPLTLRDLLTFTMGFGMVMAAPDSTPFLRALGALDLGQGPPSPQSMAGPDEWMAQLGSLPLLYQPGERWLYNTGADVLGVFVARASGRPFPAFLEQRIFAPLGMVDSGFAVPADALDRLTPSWRTDAETGEVVLYDPAGGGQWAGQPPFCSGGAGLVSTADDFSRFGRMLLAGGRVGDDRLLSAASVAELSRDQLTAGQKAHGGLGPGFFDKQAGGSGSLWPPGPPVRVGRRALSAGTGGWGPRGSQTRRRASPRC